MDNTPPEQGAQENQYLILKNAEQREVLKRRTIDLVQASEDVGTMVFLDKTARELAHLYRHTYHALYPERKLPNIRFLNIGSEKDIFVKMKLDDITSLEDLNKAYGEENVKELQNILKPADVPQKRLIIDDVENTGVTRKITERILGLINETDEYSYFIFLDSHEDRNLFKYDPAPTDDTVQYAYALPWYSKSTAVREPNYIDKHTIAPYKSFTVVPNKDPSSRAYENALRQELDLLVEEIKSDNNL